MVVENCPEIVRIRRSLWEMVFIATTRRGLIKN